jgi:hypothetical protein
MINELITSINKIKKVKLYKLEYGIMTIEFEDKINFHDMEIIKHHLKWDYNNIELPIKMIDFNTIFFKFKND